MSTRPLLSHKGSEDKKIKNQIWLLRKGHEVWCPHARGPARTWNGVCADLYFSANDPTEQCPKWKKPVPEDHSSVCPRNTEQTNLSRQNVP